VTPEAIITHLKQLVETSKNGELGYTTAAEHVNNTQLQTIFREYARQRARFIQQLQSEITRVGGTAEGSGSITAALHRSWIDVKSALSGGDGSAIVAACATGEAAAQATYEKVLDMHLSGETRLLIEQQLRKIQEAHRHMLSLKEAGLHAGSFPKSEMRG
jgi:uncharacterized protein (TIGR02284 family)